MLDISSWLPFGKNWKAWEFDLVHRGGGGPTVLDGSVYVSESNVNTNATPDPLKQDTPDPTLNATNVYSIDAQTGEKEWKFDQGSGYSRPVVANGRVFVTAQSNSATGVGDTRGPGMVSMLYAIDATTGKLDWQVELACDNERPPITDGNTVYTMSKPVGESILQVAAYDAETGDQKWQQAVGGDARRVVYANGSIFVTIVMWGIVVINAETGEIRWEREFEGNPNARTGIVVDDRVYVTADDYYGLDLETGEVTLHNDHAPYGFHMTDNRLYFVDKAGDNQYTLQAFDRETQQQEWALSGHGKLSDITAGDELVYALEQDRSHSKNRHIFTAFDRETGEAAFQRKLKRLAHGFTVVAGTAYVVCDGAVLAVDTQTSDWGEDLRTYRQFSGHHLRNFAYHEGSTSL